MHAFTRTVIALTAALVAASLLPAGTTDTTFTYQGRLRDGGLPANGLHDFEFRLFDAGSAGSQVGATLTRLDTQVTAGIFSVELNYGGIPFGSSSDLWLEITVDGETLSPRQAITHAPKSAQTRGITTNGTEASIGTEEISSRLTVSWPSSAINPFFTRNTSWLNVEGNYQDGNHFGRLVWTRTNQEPNRPKAGIVVHADDSGSTLLFGTSNSYAIGITNTGLAIDPDGDVGIGTQDPRVPLEVRGGTDVNPGSGGYVQVGHDGFNLRLDENEIMATNAGSPSTLSLNHEGGNIHMFGVGSGELGVGTTNPGFTLHVDGSAGKPGGGSWSNASDIRLKHNVHTLTDSLDQLLNLRGVTFEYVDPDAINELTGPRVGMIAQEVETVFPDWVHVRDDGYKAVTYRGFEALTVEAIRELRTEKDVEIERLTQRIEQLEALVRELSQEEIEVTR